MRPVFTFLGLGATIAGAASFLAGASASCFASGTGTTDGFSWASKWYCGTEPIVAGVLLFSVGLVVMTYGLATQRAVPARTVAPGDRHATPRGPSGL